MHKMTGGGGEGIKNTVNVIILSGGIHGAVCGLY